MSYYVYSLINPLTKLPFYIGMGQGNRAYSHLQNWDKNNKHKSGTIKKIRKEGFEPVVQILKENLSKYEAGHLETELINFYKKSNDGGILTNIADGGIGGDNSVFFTNESKKKISLRHSGENNPQHKLTNKDVLTIYNSEDTIASLSKQYQVGNAEIRKIKHRKSWLSVTASINDGPGFHYKNRFEFFTELELRSEIESIFLDGRPVHLLAEEYALGYEKIKKIKNRELYNEITKQLTLPELYRYSLTNSERDEIKNSKLSFADLSAKYNICFGTIRNIKNS